MQKRYEDEIYELKEIWRTLEDKISKQTLEHQGMLEEQEVFLLHFLLIIIITYNVKQ